jgi:Methyltransferase domain
MKSTQLDTYRASGFRNVDGWGIDEDLFDFFVMFDEFQRGHGITGSLCEIGVHHGRTFILLALLQERGERVVGIDLFESGQDQNHDASGSGSMQSLRKNLLHHAPDCQPHLVTANSFDLSVEQRGLMAPARLFHIDGGHYLEVVLNDLALAQAALGPGGIIVVDDYWHSLFPEVHEAVHRYFYTATSLRAVPFMTGKNKIFLAHTSHRERLLGFLKERLPPEKRRPIKLLGYDAICCDPH